MESPKLGPRVKLLESFSSLDALTLGPSLGDSITKVWPEIERLSHIFALTPFRHEMDAKVAFFRVSTSVYMMIC